MNRCEAVYDLERLKRNNIQQTTHRVADDITINMINRQIKRYKSQNKTIVKVQEPLPQSVLHHFTCSHINIDGPHPKGDHMEYTISW